MRRRVPKSSLTQGSRRWEWEVQRPWDQGGGIKALQGADWGDSEEVTGRGRAAPGGGWVLLSLRWPVL